MLRLVALLVGVQGSSLGLEYRLCGVDLDKEHRLRRLDVGQEHRLRRMDRGQARCLSRIIEMLFSYQDAVPAFRRSHQIDEARPHVS